MNPLTKCFSRRIFCFFLGFLQVITLVNAQVLTPPYFNLAQGRRIVATATCGEEVPEPELYCKLVGRDLETVSKFEEPNVIQGQVSS
jgi:laminin alpha 3/5